MNLKEEDKGKRQVVSDQRESHKIFGQLRAAGHEVVLLESGSAGWTFIGVINPRVRVPDGEDGLLFIRDFIRRNKRPRSTKSAPVQGFGAHARASGSPFSAGFVGFISYDLGAKWLGIKQRVKKLPTVPEAHFVYVDKVIARHRARAACDESRFEAYIKPPRPISNITYPQYLKKIAAIKKYLYAGETYQVNFSQRFEVPYNGDAFELYKKIIAVNPSPFQFFMETPKFTVISNSPERLLKVTVDREQARIIETRPIKGTVPRGRDTKEDEWNIARLLASEKDRAELTMIVDLERNDLGKLCVPGTVEVTEERTVEKYSHVTHTVANIRGVLSEQHDWYDALSALHPGGSITGCPKKRTIEIIDKLEDYQRGIYCGAAGYIGLSGNCDFNIMIRTLWFEKNKNASTITFHTGGGIVVDSIPEEEYEETFHKARAIMTTLV